jgi:hypothetical protein
MRLSALAGESSEWTSRIPGVLVREYTASAVQAGVKCGDLTKLGR